MQLRPIAVWPPRSWRSRSLRRPRPTQEREAVLALRRAEAPDAALFGDTHLHTSFSMDAGAFGARLGPRDAYRFAAARRSWRRAASP